MKSRRWKAGLLALAAVALHAMAGESDYPSRPVKLVLAMPPGGGLDIVARHLAKELTDRLGQPVVVENRPGGNSVPAAKSVASAPPDGYTLWLASNSPMMTNAVIYRNLSYDPLTEFTPIARMLRLPLALVVPASSPYRTLQGLMAVGLESPGELNYATGSVTYQVYTELINERHHVKANPVPYKGTMPAVNDVAAGNVDYMIGEVNSVLPLARAGKVRVLAVTSAQRLKDLPDVPTVAESGVPGFQADGWIGLYGPAHMPEKVVGKLYEAVAGILQSPSTVRTIEALNGVAFRAGPRQLARSSGMRSNGPGWS